MIETKYPKYYTIMENIIKQIENEELVPGQNIPAERELIEMYKVSRITVRKAIDELVSKGYLYKIQGKGTYVKKSNIKQGLVKLTSCTEDIAKTGMKATIKQLDKEIIKANKKIANHLEINEGDKVLKIVRVFLGDGNPINITTSYMKYENIKGVEDYDLSQNSLYKILETEFDITIIKANRTIEAVLSHGYISKNLNIQDNQPLLYFTGEVYGKKNDEEFVLEYFESAYATNVCKFYLEQYR